MTARFGFRILGDVSGERRLIDWDVAFNAHCACDARAEVGRESYLSAFTFGDDFRDHLESTGSTRGFAGPCGAAWLWFDLDADDLDRAANDARRLAAFLADRFARDGDELLIFFSGSKGFHIGLPLAICGSPPPSATFHQVCRALAERLAELAGVAIDAGVYDRVRAFRAPNSRHPKSGLHKRRLLFDELLRLNVDGILKLAAEPVGFDVPDAPPANEQARRDWGEAIERVARQQAAHAERRAVGGAKLNRATMDFIKSGAGVGDRHRMLFSAAANLAEFGCPAELAHALLTEAALDAGLSPGEVRRQIECGLNHRPPDASPPRVGTLFAVGPRKKEGYYDARL